jgi:glucokinase
LILAGDIGGTNSRLAVFDQDLQKIEEKVYPNAGRSSLQEIVQEYTRGLSYHFDRACFGVAGPVAEGKVALTNLSWQLDEQSLATDLKVPRVGLINDLVAHAESIEVLKPEHFITLREGDPVPGGGRGIIAAGTGLGEAGLFFDSKINRYRAWPSEGGHSDFAPQDEEQERLLKFLRGKLGRVSWESVLSGPGLKNVYDFVCSTSQFPKSDQLSMPEVKPADVTDAGLKGTSRAAAKALDLFIALYGAEAGNLALKALANNGLYVGGGIAPRIIEKLRNGPAFLQSFDAKSVPKIQGILSKFPVRVINFDLGALYGAANYASRL